MTSRERQDATSVKGAELSPEVRIMKPAGQERAAGKRTTGLADVRGPYCLVGDGMIMREMRGSQAMGM